MNTVCLSSHEGRICSRILLFPIWSVRTEKIQSPKEEVKSKEQSCVKLKSCLVDVGFPALTSKPHFIIAIAPETQQIQAGDLLWIKTQRVDFLLHVSLSGLWGLFVRQNQTSETVILALQHHVINLFMINSVGLMCHIRKPLIYSTLGGRMCCSGAFNSFINSQSVQN